MKVKVTEALRFRAERTKVWPGAELVNFSQSLENLKKMSEHRFYLL